MNFNFNLFSLIVIYISFSIPIFLRVYNTSRVVIDEEFHIRQAKQYCHGNFHVWDPKITTFPGLYILSYILIPFKFCTTFYLRLIVLLSSVINVYFLYKIQRFKTNNDSLLVISALSISILPPMYFFAHIFYTDIVSVTTILGLYYFWLKSDHKIAAFWGILAVLMRQTNIVWVTMLLGTSAIDELFASYKKFHTKKKQNNNFKELIQCLKFLMSNFDELIKFVQRILSSFWMYIMIIVGFMIFLVKNGSIVVGDKTAHTANLHIPQIFYYSLYVLFFGYSILTPYIKSSIQMIWKNKLIFSLILILSLVIVKFNTIEHPYLLADNRHYVFYIWNRCYVKYNYFKYLIVPVYLFGLTLMINCLNSSSKFSFNLMYYISTIIVLTLQNLIEIRYFMIPFLLLRLNIKAKNKFLILLELFNYITINCLTFYIFFTKEIYWNDFEEIQRLMW